MRSILIPGDSGHMIHIIDWHSFTLYSLGVKKLKTKEMTGLSTTATLLVFALLVYLVYRLFRSKMK